MNNLISEKDTEVYNMPICLNPPIVVDHYKKQRSTTKFNKIRRKICSRYPVVIKCDRDARIMLEQIQKLLLTKLSPELALFLIAAIVMPKSALTAFKK